MKQLYTPYERIIIEVYGDTMSNPKLAEMLQCSISKIVDMKKYLDAERADKRIEWGSAKQVSEF